MYNEEEEVRRLIAIYKLLDKEIRDELSEDRTEVSLSADMAMKLLVESRFALLNLANEIAKRTYEG